jgi:energy-coupling factor transport system ATP-binding protein
MMDISVDTLSFTYPSGVLALNGISLRISTGESVAIIGQNGAGKTTLVKHFNGLLKPSFGSVRVGDWDTRGHSVAKLAAKVGYVFQNPDDQLFQPTVWSEIIFGPKNMGKSMEQISELANSALRAVELSASAQKHPYDLFASQRKMVALAAVLAMDTPIIILDEPTTGQDFSSTQRIGQIVETLIQQHKTVITITHDIDFCAEHFERVVVMAQGSVLIDGHTRDVLSQTDTLAQTFVEPPQLMRLAARLGMETRPLNAEEFVNYWSLR